MRITIKDHLPGHCGSVTHDAEIEPIVLHLSAKDRENIAAMHPEATRIIAFPEGMTQEEAVALLQDETPVPWEVGLSPARADQALKAIQAGSLDEAIAILQSACPPHSLPPATAQGIPA